VPRRRGRESVVAKTRIKRLHCPGNRRSYVGSYRQSKMKSSNFKAVIFDMDGVIVDSEPRHERAFLEVVHEIGYSQTHGVQWADWVGRSDHELWLDFVAKHKPAQSLEQLLKMKRDRVLEIIRREEPIFAGLGELVEKLSRVGKLGLASGSERPVVEAVLSLQDLRRFFSAIVTASDIKHGKPRRIFFCARRSCWSLRPRTAGSSRIPNRGLPLVSPPGCV